MMKRKIATRLGFHLANYIVVLTIMFISTSFYFFLNSSKTADLLDTVRAFVDERLNNYIFISVAVYLLCYIFGLIKYTLDERRFRVQNYLASLFKLMVILGMVSFAEFYIFYLSKIGRLIYLYTFVLLGLYMLLYSLFRGRSDSVRRLLWLTSEEASGILDRYAGGYNRFDVVPQSKIREGEFTNAEIVYSAGETNEDTSEILIQSKLAGNRVIDLVELIEKEAGKIPVEYVDIKWFLDKFDVGNRNYFRVNRVLNILFASLLTVMLFPPALFVAAIHKIFSSGPLFFVQERVGLNGKKFRLIKFRTMVKDAEKYGAKFASKGDKRITPIGKFMRRTRVDEIPQLLNVLKGDMSLVGPRPEREVFINRLGEIIPYYKLRLLVPPGLTGWAQVNGCYAGDDPEEHKEKLEYDLYYIKRRGIVLDLLTLLMTFRTVIDGKGQ